MDEHEQYTTKQKIKKTEMQTILTSSFFNSFQAFSDKNSVAG